MKYSSKMVIMLASVAAAMSGLLIGDTIFLSASAQNMTGDMGQKIQSQLQSSPQQLPVQQGSHVFVIICTDPSNVETCQLYDLRAVQ